MQQQRRSGSPVPRQQVFALADGNYVVQWSETSVQDLLTGAYYTYTLTDFGHPIYDYELTQLKASGVIEAFDRAYVWLYAMPERDRFTLRLQTESSNRVRAYYINTTLPSDAIFDVQERFEALNLLDQFCVCEHEGLIGIFNRDGTPFADVQTAELVQRKLEFHMPDLFSEAAVAFTETDSALPSSLEEVPLDLEALIEAERAVINTRVVIAVHDEDDRQMIMRVLTRMRAAAAAAASGAEALALLEDEPADLLILDVQLVDMHAWTLLSKIREIDAQRAAHVIAIANAGDLDVREQALALLVAKVNGYVLRPLDQAALRHTILTALQTT